MMEEKKRVDLAQLIDRYYTKTPEFGDDVVTSTDIADIIEKNEMGFISVPDINQLMEAWGFEGETIKPTADKLWKVVMK